ncbi:MAG: hypothetical protein JW807_07250 [Spirochaetes bacterium]|nr:hypothetical protein [Spirochaetota bacterium]
MRSRFKKTTCSLALLCALLGWAAAARADTFFLNDGQVLVGKVIRETALAYIVANSYGTFTVGKARISKIYITRSYREDITIHKKLGLKTNEDYIRKNYEEGIRRKKIEEALEKEKKKLYKAGKTGVPSNLWKYGRLGVEGVYYSTIISPPLFARVPHGLAASLMYDQGLDLMIGKRHMAMPGLRVEAGVIDFERKFFFKSSRRLSGYFLLAGPLWALPSLDNSWGCVVLAALPGAGYYYITNDDSASRSNDFHFTCAGIVGYEYSFKVVSLFIHFRYIYILDQDIAFNGIGGSAGIAFRLW